MAADIAINEWNGTVNSQIATNKTGGTVRFKSADNAVVNNSDPLRRPNTGVYRSFEKWLRLNIVDLDDADNVSNLEVFAEGTPNAGVSIWARAYASYCNAAGNELADPNSPRSGGRASTGALPNPKVNLFTYTSESPLSLGAGPYTVNVDDGDIVEAGIGSYVALQMDVAPSAAEATTSSYSLVFRYDEE